VRCETAQLVLSEAMDERVDVPGRVEAHLKGCQACSAFVDGAWRVRELARFGTAPPVPDLVTAIMDAVAEGTGKATGPHRGSLGAFVVRRRALALAVAAGLVVGFVLSAGGTTLRDGTGSAALASEIPARLVGAAVGLEGYRATISITELHWTDEVPVRTFQADLAFRAPEGFRVQVRDTSIYPSGVWPRNDLLLQTDGRTWWASGPNPCPALTLPACPDPGPAERARIRRPPFDPGSPMPTDVIVPMTVLAAADRVEVLGSDVVAGHPAVTVRLAYQDAGTLFRYLTFLGSWRPFFPRDTVVLWLDRDTWFPLQYRVYPASGQERALWAAQNGIAPEPPGAPVFTATSSFVSADPPPASLFSNDPAEPLSPRAPPPDGPATTVNQGFEDADLDAALPEVAAGFAPGDTAGLTLWRAGRFLPADGSPPAARTMAAYADGLAWLTVTLVDPWTQPRLFGVGAFAEEVPLPNGVGYFEPASGVEPRRVAIHSARGELLVASNLPRSTLLRVAGSIAVAGLPEPTEWQVRRWDGGRVTARQDPHEALAGASFPVQEPTFLPRGYRPAAAETIATSVGTGVTIVYRRESAELDGVGLRFHQGMGQTLAPPTGEGQQVVDVQGVPGRWSPQDHLLEWMDGPLYRSLAGPAFDLDTLLRVARSLRDVPEGRGP
jgi:hypothetical protein